MVDKACYGCDIATEAIEKIYKRAEVQTKTTLVQCNFETDMNEKFIEKLKDAKFSTTAPTLLVWEGGTFYVNKGTVQHCLQYLNTRVNISNLVIDYMNADIFNPPLHAKAQAQLALVESIGAPWKSFFTMPEIKEMYKKLGFNDIDLTEHGDVEKMVMGSVQLDQAIMYLTTAR